MLSQVATKRDLQQLKAEFKREFTVRLCLILAGSMILVFGLLKAF